MHTICVMIQSKEPHLSTITGNFILEKGVLLCGVSVQRVQGVGEVGEQREKGPRGAEDLAGDVRAGALLAAPNGLGVMNLQYRGKKRSYLFILLFHCLFSLEVSMCMWVVGGKVDRRWERTDWCCVGRVSMRMAALWLQIDSVMHAAAGRVRAGRFISTEVQWWVPGLKCQHFSQQKRWCLLFLNYVQSSS